MQEINTFGVTQKKIIENLLEVLNLTKSHPWILSLTDRESIEKIYGRLERKHAKQLQEGLISERYKVTK